MDRELGRFLKSRREAATPAECGVLTGPRRRVPGLRREEVAQLAGISVEYYVRLEQGRARAPSPEVLDALARTLRLDDVERRHLDDLASARPTRPPSARRARPELAQLLAKLDRVPALVVDHRLDVLAGNPLSAQLFRGFATANLARFCLLDPASREVFPDWHDVARATVGQLRLVAARYATDPALAALVGELTLRSETFRTLWAGRFVQQRTHGRKRFRHPVAGELTLQFENFELPDSSGQRLVTFTAEPGSPSESALDLLAHWAA
ncbi:helix-turn-helix transcriptional regulator [Amycolatopsis sp. lyj-23]|uniref:helix-turn-helix transcriptional regulator n=1 Tax=Amycolatopsis sp. lyj-23 TaxID=2789283 RepID=UPI00397B507F